MNAERKPRRGPRPHPSETVPTRAVPLFQAQPIRRNAEAESAFDRAVTRAYSRPATAAPRGAGVARRIQTALLALLILVGGSVATFLLLERAHDSFRRPLPRPRSAATVTPHSAAELLARRAYPEALVAYRSLARAHPREPLYAAIAELIEARLDPPAGPSR